MNFAKGFLLLIAPIAPFTFSVGVSPSLAATLGSSEATVGINNFSHDPLAVQALAETYTDLIATNNLVNVSVDNTAVAEFIIDPTSAYNSSSSKANADGNSYFGQAEGKSAVIGYNFSVNSGETFSFNFDAALNLATSIDNPQFEIANATGSIKFELYDTTNQDSWVRLDSFKLYGNLTTSGNKDYLKYDASKNVTFNLLGDTDFGGNQESISGLTQGLFSRTFDRLTDLTLVEVANTQVSINAGDADSVKVPEPSSVLGLLLCVIGMGYRFTSQALRAKSTRTLR